LHKRETNNLCIKGCQNRDFASGRKRKAKSSVVKSQSKSMDCLF